MIRNGAVVIRFQQTFNPPTSKASAWQALTRLAVANAMEERPMSNLESGSEIGGMTSVSSQIFEKTNNGTRRSASLHSEIHVIGDTRGLMCSSYRCDYFKLDRDRGRQRTDFNRRTRRVWLAGSGEMFCVELVVDGKVFLHVRQENRDIDDVLPRRAG